MTLMRYVYFKLSHVIFYSICNFIKLFYKDKVTTTADTNCCGSVLYKYVDFGERERHLPEKNPRSSVEIKYGNSIRMK